MDRQTDTDTYRERKGGKKEGMGGGRGRWSIERDGGWFIYASGIAIYLHLFLAFGHSDHRAMEWAVDGLSGNRT